MVVAMTLPADEPKKPKKRSQFGKRYKNGVRKVPLAEQQRKVAAYMNMLKIASEK
jgi:hypothetical protein